MLNFFKCKFYKKFKLFISFYPLQKILKFKKTKWTLTQKRLLRLNPRLFLFYKRLNKNRFRTNRPPRAYFKNRDLIAFKIFAQNSRKVASLRYSRLLRKWKSFRFHFLLSLIKKCKLNLFLNRKKYSLTRDKRFATRVLDIKKPRLLFNVRKLKKDYKSATLVLNSFKHYLGEQISIRKLKGVLKFYKLSKLTFFIKFLFNLDVLLCQLNLFASLRQFSLAVRLDKILKNKIIINSSSHLVRGDVIQVLSPFFFNISLDGNVPFFYSFCEIDLYSNTLVILKNFSELKSGTSNMFIKQLVNISLFIYYLRKK